jgi:hypothetical protein
VCIKNFDQWPPRSDSFAAIRTGTANKLLEAKEKERAKEKPGGSSTNTKSGKRRRRCVYLVVQRDVPEIHDCCSILSAHPRRLVQNPTLALIQTQDQTQIPLHLVPTRTHRPDPRVHVQGLARVRPTVKGSVGGVFHRQIAATVDVECRIGEDATRAKTHPTTADGDDSHYPVRAPQVDIHRIGHTPNCFFLHR